MTDLEYFPMSCLLEINVFLTLNAWFCAITTKTFTIVPYYHFWIISNVVESKIS